VRRAGLDYWPRVNPRIWPDWAALEAWLPELGEPFLFSPDAPRDLWSVRFPERCVLVFGSESVGFPPELRQRYADRLVKIPMHDPVTGETVEVLWVKGSGGDLVEKERRRRRERGGSGRGEGRRKARGACRRRAGRRRRRRSSRGSRRRGSGASRRGE